jgi:hypothetical protein
MNISMLKVFGCCPQTRDKMETCACMVRVTACIRLLMWPSIFVLRVANLYRRPCSLFTLDRARILQKSCPNEGTLLTDVVHNLAVVN